MQVKYSNQRGKLSHLVANTDQVIAKLFHRVGRRARLNGLWIMCHKDGLRRLDDDDAFFPLRYLPLALLYSQAFFEYSCTFFPYKLLSSAFIVTYLLPPT